MDDKFQNYCRGTDCPVQRNIDAGPPWDEDPDKFAKRIRNTNCTNCRVWQFTKWLRDNEYKIVKEVDSDESK